MLVITTYSPVVHQVHALQIDSDWCLELAASVDAEPAPARTRYIFETLAVHPTRKFVLACGNQPERRSLNSPYFRLLKARVSHVKQTPRRTPVSSLKLAVNPSCRAYLKLDEQKQFGAKPNSKKLRQLICTMSEVQKTAVPVPQDAVRTAFDPVRTVRLQPFFVGQPMFSPA